MTQNPSFCKGSRKPRTLLRMFGILVSVLSLLMGFSILSSPAQANDNGPGWTVDPAGDPVEPVYTVENWRHPGAERIAATTNVYLKTGNGNLLYEPCDDRKDDNQIQVDASDFTKKTGRFLCFTIINRDLPAVLEMEIPGSMGVRSLAGKETQVRTIEPSTNRTATQTIGPKEKDGFKDIFQNQNTQEDVILVKIAVNTPA